MSTSLKLEEMSPEIQALIRRMHERDECFVVKDEEGPIAYFNVAFRPDLNAKQRRDHDFSDVPLKEPVPRVRYDRRGMPTVRAAVGARMVTSEEIYEELRGEDFP